MVESEHMLDPVLSIPVYSLYAEKRRPEPEMFDAFDVLLVDLIDVGTRVYTFAWTVIYCLQVAAETGRKVIILDRPNPIGGMLVEGNLLKDEWFSFVGLYALPMRHGLTLGELALLCNSEMKIGADLDVVRMQGWQRDMLFADTGLPWVFPSPNMPTPTTALVYPGQVMWEGTNVSEGRGTTMPFELVGAPFIRLNDVKRFLARSMMPGCVVRPLIFEPTSGKWAGEVCQGFQIHVTDAEAYRPYRTSLTLLQVLLTLYPDGFTYKDPPYEYDYEHLPMDLILGDRKVRRALDEGVAIQDLEQSWREELTGFEDLRRSVLLYG